ncbi:MAG: hypothetical protein WCI73_14300 [Phycisphaerae bacterium]
MPLDVFRMTTEKVELGYMVVDGEVVGVASRDGGFLHIGVIESWRKRWATRGFIRRIIQWAAETGPVKTGVMHANLAGHRLVEGVGFVKTMTNERGIAYEIPTDAI